MSAFVMDCSIAMAWCFEDECDQYADAVLGALGKTQALVPSVWLLEVANVLLVAERRKRLREAESTRFIELLSGLPIVIEELTHDRALGSIISSARDFSLSSYDSAYLDLAMRHGIPLATRDKALRAACKKSGVSLFRP